MLEILTEIWNTLRQSIVNIGIGMTQANFSFLILVIGIWQLHEMKKRNRR